MSRRLAEKDVRATVAKAWHDLGEPDIDADALGKIRKLLDQALPGDWSISPAAIARILADEGAGLRHPEIIECDARWRESQIEIETAKFSEVAVLSGTRPMPLDEAEAVIRGLEKLRVEFDRAADAEAAAHLRALAAEARNTAASRGENKSLAASVRAEQNEIAEWLRIWLQTPNLFESWLDLRKSSPDFKRKFR